MTRRYDLVVVGMGSGGMTAAELAGRLGLDVLVVERARVGGDCLWTGCVPSKALLASAKAAHTIRHADRYGLAPGEGVVDTAAVWRRLRAVQARIATTDDDPDRYRAMGVEVVHGHASLAGPNTVEIDGTAVRTRYVLVCAGSRPSEPEVPGLHQAGYLTSENVFELEQPPRSVTMIGGGPIAVEMAQAFTRLGIATTVLQRGPGVLPRDEPELVRSLTRRLVDEGVDLRLGVRTERVEVADGAKIVHGTQDGEPRSWRAEELFVAVGRSPNVEGLGAEEIGVAVGPRGIEVDDRLRTAVPTIYAAGDVTGRFLFTHSAGYDAVTAVRNMFFPLSARAPELVPWCTFTDPELAHAGLTVAEAEERHGGDVEVWRHDLAHSDRARADGTDDGAIVVVTHKGRVVGAHVLAPAAGEMIHELALAIRHGMKLGDVTKLVHVYPTLSTGIGQLAADSAYEKAARLRWIINVQRRRDRASASRDAEPPRRWWDAAGRVGRLSGRSSPRRRGGCGP